MSRPSTTANLYPPSAASAHPATAQPGGTLNSRTLTLWIHDPDATSALSKNEAILNYELFPKGVAKPGDIAEVSLIPLVALPPAGGNAPGDGYPSGSVAVDNASGIPTSERRSAGHKESYTGSAGGDEEKPSSLEGSPEEEGKFLFVIRELTEAQRKLNVQVVSN